jgi:hypothetical protein
MNASRHLVRLSPAAAVALVLVAIPTTWAAADTHSPSLSTSSRDQVMRLSYTPLNMHAGDVDPQGISSGDTLQVAFRLTGQVSGSADYACTAVNTIYLCSGVLRLPDGDIYVATGPTDDTLPAAIVGGTLDYAGITGQFTKRANPDGSGTYVLAFHG